MNMNHIQREGQRKTRAIPKKYCHIKPYVGSLNSIHPPVIAGSQSLLLNTHLLCLLHYNQRITLVNKEHTL